MIFDFIFGFVLALVVGGCVALASITLGLRRETRDAALRTATLRQRFEKQSLRLDDLQAQSPTELAGRVAELSETVARLASTQRRFQGRFDQYVHEKPSEPDEPTDRAALRRAHAASIMPTGIRRE